MAREFGALVFLLVGLAVLVAGGVWPDQAQAVVDWFADDDR